MVVFSFFCLPIAVLMPVLAHDDLGIAENTVAYGLLYATFGAGAVVGALSIGTFLARRSLEGIVRVGLGGFAVTLAAFGLLRTAPPAYPVAFLLGLFYFATVTSLATVLQSRLDDGVRGRVMALWVMAFGGTVPLGAIVAGPLSGAIGISAVVLGGAVVAAALVRCHRPPRPTRRRGTFRGGGRRIDPERDEGGQVGLRSDRYSGCSVNHCEARLMLSSFFLLMNP